MWLLATFFPRVAKIAWPIMAVSLTIVTYLILYHLRGGTQARTKSELTESLRVDTESLRVDTESLRVDRGSARNIKCGDVLYFGAWLSLVERYVRDVEVAGSNPVAPIGEMPEKPNVLLAFPDSWASMSMSSEWSGNDSN